MDLKDIVKKIKKHKNVRFVNNKLFAAENGFLEFDCKVTGVITQPNNKFIFNDNEIKFLGACEVLSIEIDKNSIYNENSSINNYFHFENNIKINNKDINQTIESINFKNESLGNESNDNIFILLDTDKINLSTLNLTNYKKGITVSRSGRGNDIIMNSGTSSSINLNSLKPNTNYNISIEGERLRGNGKINIGFDIKNLTEVSLPERRREFNLKVKTGNEKNNSLILSRTHGAIGLISIKRITVKEIKDQTSLENKNNLLFLQDPGNYQENKQQNQNQNQNQIVNNNFIIKSSENKISETSKLHAIYYKQNFIPNISFDLDFCVAPVTISSKKWISKILPFFPKAKIYSGISGISGIEKSNNINLSICSLENIAYAENIFLEEWIGEIKNEKSLEILKRSKRIIVNSLINTIELKSKIDNVEIIHISKFWPSLDVNIENKNDKYFIYFEKNEEITKNLINGFNNNLCKLIIVGSRLKLPENIIQYSEYVEYSDIINLLYKSSSLIDLSFNNHYDSSIINLAIRHNIPVITNNNFYNKNLNNVNILRSFDVESINYYFNNASINNFELKFNQNFNLELNNIISKMIGID